MFSTKKNILQTVALLKAYGIKQIVLSPGSRNAPLMQTFTQEPYFNCHIIVDERNAAFYALGIIQATLEPVAICCTSGSALLNYAPAVSEAYYQQLPLIVISADRSPEWIGQMDGQTLPQPGVFGSLVKKAVNLPEIKNETDEWYCNRLINEALITCTSNAPGPVQINIPLGEPLFDYSEKNLPEVRKIHPSRPLKTVKIKPFIEKWNALPKRIILIGQMFYSQELLKTLETLTDKYGCVILTEHISNCTSSDFISNFDTLLYSLPEEAKETYRPDLLITLGGHIISKRLKHFFRQFKPKEHWLLTESGEITDLFQSLTDLIEADSITFLSELAQSSYETESSNFYHLWKDSTNRIEEPSDDIPYTDIWATKQFLKTLPPNSVLHLANSSAVRNAQLFQIDKSIRIYSNRGVNGIESTLPSVIGFASVHPDPVYLIIGDLSFFYGLNALWNIKHIHNLRILLVNNGGGGIFHLLPGLNKSASLNEYVAAEHSTNAKDWAVAAGIGYLSAKGKEELKSQFSSFMAESSKQSIILEVIVDMETCKKTFQEYFHNQKQRIN
ncbi:2-succinyl-5-enolpyruvyl-6-hydroxy-3-cyclohexene-1-carboxylic-acid synthase [Dysgonomonas macrotermitis]|uniref:2-succinyl-5-enolpyruvyl-6-hydroxy-3-cyclohexene-1-carboxylate synthase n=1 Tax=Dysgonomonas macrotermitis TaxID=1346286 RepID=A0A1M5BI67_9BACT|nr:2-succinyl-5-enolpyruvyl-6-hydroxy-3-cyclohexene-1-carboxylic-acid synthase [Dysgonomonas macrotermitis]SHF42138.1 2-succinyl-5-enolpyruvyl-6-hydroxy-3-cyclohexene-1-carboxylate synthase [Dysgonomonas macrotermitis]